MNDRNNEIEKINVIIDYSNDQLLKLINDNKSLKYGNILIICEQVSLGILLPQIFPIEESLVVMSFFLVSTKGALTMIFGTKKKNNKLINKYNNIINKCVSEKEKVIKKENNICDVYTKENEYLNYDYNHNMNIINNKKKIRILSNKKI